MATSRLPCTKEHPAVAQVRRSGAQKVKVAVSDIDGVLRGKYLHIDKFLGACAPYPTGGFGFCGAVLGRDMIDATYDKTSATGWQEWFKVLETPQSWAAKKAVGPEPLTPGMFGQG